MAILPGNSVKIITIGTKSNKTAPSLQFEGTFVEETGSTGFTPEGQINPKERWIHISYIGTKYNFNSVGKVVGSQKGEVIMSIPKKNIVSITKIL